MDANDGARSRGFVDDFGAASLTGECGCEPVEAERSLSPDLFDILLSLLCFLESPKTCQEMIPFRIDRVFKIERFSID